MGRVYKPIVYKRLPDGAELFTRKGERFAKWTDRRGRVRTASVAVPKRGEHVGQARLVVASGRYVAEYRDGDGKHSIPTGCRDETAARGVLRELERRSELVKGNLLSASEARTADHQSTPLTEHFAAFATYLSMRASSAMHRTNVAGRLRRLAAECGFAKLADLERCKLETWLANAPAIMSARTRNGYVTALTSFCNWCVAAGRMVANPFARMHRANERADQRRPRRALTAAELARLIEAAYRRPLAEYGRKPIRLDGAADSQRKRRVSWTYEAVTAVNIGACEARALERLRDRPDLRVGSEAAGRARALTYKALALTGLRLGELRALTVGAAELDGAAPFVALRAADEKARRGADVPLRADLAGDLSRHLAGRLREAQWAAQAAGRPIPTRLPADAPLIDVPDGLVKRLNRDLVAAGLATADFDPRRGKWHADKRDQLGRGLDVHCLRHTFNSLLAVAGVPLTTRQILMRHAAQTVTDAHYTDRTLIDLRAALDKLPRLPLDGERPGAERHVATGTDDAAPVCCLVCSARDDSSACGAIAGNSSENASAPTIAVSDGADTVNATLSLADPLRALGLEPRTHGLKGRCSTD